MVGLLTSRVPSEARQPIRHDATGEAAYRPLSSTIRRKWGQGFEVPSHSKYRSPEVALAQMGILMSPGESAQRLQRNQHRSWKPGRGQRVFS